MYLWLKSCEAPDETCYTDSGYLMVLHQKLVKRVLTSVIILVYNLEMPHKNILTYFSTSFIFWFTMTFSLPVPPHPKFFVSSLPKVSYAAYCFCS